MNELHLTRQQSRNVDTIAIEQFGIPGVVLMENAGRNSAQIIQAEFESLSRRGEILIACGPGNNGGDGLVIARHLTNWNIPVEVLLVGSPDQLSHDATINFQIVDKMQVNLTHLEKNGDPNQAIQTIMNRSTPAVFVDALLGTGAQGEPRPPIAPLVAWANRTDLLRIAIDSPTGLDCETGQVSPTTFQAKLTLTFVAKKTGFQKETAASVLGTCHVIDIGIPKEILNLV